MDSTLLRSQNSLRCQLLELPPELRVCIYECLFSPCQRSFSVIDVVYREGRARDVAPLPVAMLWTCKLIYAEASAVLYDNITFVITICITIDGRQSPCCLGHVELSHFFNREHFMSSYLDRDLTCLEVLLHALDNGARLEHLGLYLST